MSNEFSEIMQSTGESRPVMSVPPRVIASAKFIREVQRELDIADDDRARDAADWIIDKMERFGAYAARGVFDLEGNGPQCSWCGGIWPLCGHHHQAFQAHDGESESDGSEATSPPHIEHLTAASAYEGRCLEGDCEHVDEDGQPEDLSACPTVPPFEVCVDCMDASGAGRDPENWDDAPLIEWPCAAMTSGKQDEGRDNGNEETR